MSISFDLTEALTARAATLPMGMFHDGGSLVVSAASEYLVIGVIKECFGGWIQKFGLWHEINPHHGIGRAISGALLLPNIDADTSYSNLFMQALCDTHLSWKESDRRRNNSIVWACFWSALSRADKDFASAQHTGAVFALEAMHQFGVPNLDRYNRGFCLWKLREFAAQDRVVRRGLNSELLCGRATLAFTNVLGKSQARRFLKLLHKIEGGNNSDFCVASVLEFLGDKKAYRCLA